MVLFHIESITVNAGYVAIKLTKDRKWFFAREAHNNLMRAIIFKVIIIVKGMALKLPYASAI